LRAFHCAGGAALVEVGSGKVTKGRAQDGVGREKQNPHDITLSVRPVPLACPIRQQKAPGEPPPRARRL